LFFQELSPNAGDIFKQAKSNPKFLIYLPLIKIHKIKDLTFQSLKNTYFFFVLV
jgi:hypothetical protein